VKHKKVKLETVLPDKAITGKDVYQAVVKDAFEKNTELQRKEIIDLSVKYSVLSKKTAFIGIQRNKGKVGGDMESIKIPIPIAKDSEVQDIEDYGIESFRVSKRYRAREPEYGSLSGRGEILLGALSIPSSTVAPRGDEIKLGVLRDLKSIKNDKEGESRGKVKIIEECSQKSDEKYYKGIRLDSKRKAPRISYMEIVGKQELYGNWKWEKTTLSVIGIAEDKAQSNIPEELKVQFNNVKILREVWITILALVKLEIDYASSKESWQLVFKKAVEWLKNSGINYAKYKQAAEKVIH